MYIKRNNVLIFNIKYTKIKEYHDYALCRDVEIESRNTTADMHAHIYSIYVRRSTARIVHYERRLLYIINVNIHKYI